MNLNGVNRRPSILKYPEFEAHVLASWLIEARLSPICGLEQILATPVPTFPSE